MRRRSTCHETNEGFETVPRPRHRHGRAGDASVSAGSERPRYARAKVDPLPSRTGARREHAPVPAAAFQPCSSATRTTAPSFPGQQPRLGRRPVHVRPRTSPSTASGS
eukprot:scaffold1386_cov342-Pavlova_lutheri.AAC.23